MSLIQIQTKRSRDSPQTNIEREGLKTDKKPIGVRNEYHLKNVKKTEVQTSWGEKDVVLKTPNLSREQKALQMIRLKKRYKGRKTALSISHKKYKANVNANGYERQRDNTETTKEEADTMQVAAFTGGIIRTAVGGTHNATSRIQTAVNRGVSSALAADTRSSAGKIGLKAADTAISAVRESSRTLIQTRVDNSSVCDTGSQAAKQGADNMKLLSKTKAKIGKVFQGRIRTASAVNKRPEKESQRITKARERYIRKNRAAKAVSKGKKGKAVAQKSISFAGNIISSKGFYIIALAAALILICVTLVSGFISLLLSTISSLFSWFEPSGAGAVNSYQYLQQYKAAVQQIEAELQEDIDDEYEYTPEYRYDDSEITSLDQYGNMTLFVDENGVVAAAAVIEYMRGNDIIADETIRDVVDSFYSFSTSISNGYCPDCACMIDENKELTIENGDFSVSNTSYIESSDKYAVTFKGSCYEHTSSVYTELTVGTSDGDITGSGNAIINGNEWEITYNFDSDGYGKIDWDDITIKATTIYCDNPNHYIYEGEVKNLECDEAISELGFGEDQQTLFWTYYYYVGQGGIK